jgi:hypothetical protein
MCSFPAHWAVFSMSMFDKNLHIWYLNLEKHALFSQSDMCQKLSFHVKTESILDVKCIFYMERR